MRIAKVFEKELSPLADTLSSMTGVDISPIGAYPADDMRRVEGYEWRDYREYLDHCREHSAAFSFAQWQRFYKMNNLDIAMAGFNGVYWCVNSHNRLLTVRESRYALAHELGHVLLYRLSGVSSLDEYDAVYRIPDPNDCERVLRLEEGFAEHIAQGLSRTFRCVRPRTAREDLPRFRSYWRSRVLVSTVRDEALTTLQLLKTVTR
jgi:hypothetical protein